MYDNRCSFVTHTVNVFAHDPPLPASARRPPLPATTYADVMTFSIAVRSCTVYWQYLQQFWKREEQLGGAAERDPCDVARRLLERR